MMKPRGFYAVLDRDDEQLARTLIEQGGARILQVRIKPALADEIIRVGRMARRICTELGAALVINDRVDIALTVGADAVHLGQTDLPIAEARKIAGDRLAYGISTHNLDQVRAAITERPDYIAYGPVFATTTKLDPDPVVGLEALRSAVQVAGDIPVVAIGGISPSDARDIYEVGASSICAISAVNAAHNVPRAVQAICGRPWLTHTGTYSILRWYPAPLQME
jgi:thiamine-phosphate pyrophosphorylase